MERSSNCRRHAGEVSAGSGVQRDGHLTSKVKRFFLLRYFCKIAEIFLPYFGILQQLQDQFRRGGAAQDGVWREIWRVGGTPDFKSVKMFFPQISCKYFYLILQLHDQFRRGGAAQDGVLREGWRVGGTPDFKREKMFFPQISCKYFYLILELQDQFRRGEAAQEGVWREGWRDT